MLAILITSAAGAAACLALGLVLRLSGRLGAADRHENLSLAVALALLMPILVLAMPASLRLDLPAHVAPRGLRDEMVTRGTTPPGEATAAVGVTPASRPESSPDGAARSPVLNATTAALGLWALGTLFFALRLARSGQIAARIRRRAGPFGRDADVLVSAEVRVPMVTGILAPAIVLPADAALWSAEDLALTLLHERAHLARRDVPKQWAASVVCALYWFNPLAWIVARTMATDREHAVDAMVLEAGARASSYAALLLRVARRAEESPLLAPFHAPAVGRADLTRRVEAVLGTPRARASRLRRAACATAIVAAAFTVACSQGPVPSSTTAGPIAPAPASVVAHATTPSASMLERALGGPATLDAAKQSATEAMLEAWLAEDDSVLHAHAIAMELPSGRIVALAGRDRTSGPVLGLERVYPPGSTIKPLVVAAALDAGVLRKDELIDGQGGSRELTTASGKRHTMTDFSPQGRMSLAKMLAVSSNVGATKVGERLGGPALLGALDAACIFEPIDGLSLAAPLRPASGGDAWHHAVVSIGHDFRVNPLRVVAAFGGLASEGEVVAPRLREGAPRNARRFVSREAARAVTEMLESVVAEGGTGALAQVNGLRVAGKTGTADLEGGLLYASFVGIFPAEAPRHVVLVGAETTTGTGPRTAAPRFAKLVARAFR